MKLKPAPQPVHVKLALKWIRAALTRAFSASCSSRIRWARAKWSIFSNALIWEEINKRYLTLCCCCWQTDSQHPRDATHEEVEVKWKTWEWELDEMQTTQFRWVTGDHGVNVTLNTQTRSVTWVYFILEAVRVKREENNTNYLLSHNKLKAQWARKLKM